MRLSQGLAAVALLTLVSMPAGAAPGFHCDPERGSCTCDPSKGSDCEMMKANCVNHDIDQCSTKSGKTTCMCVVAARTTPGGVVKVHPALSRTH